MEDSAADLCSRCISIPWDSLERSMFEELWKGEKPTVGDLQTSSCRLCRLITSAMIPALIQHAHLQSVIWLSWTRTGKHGHRCLGSIGLWLDSGIFVGELILTTGDCGIVAPKRVNFTKVRPWLEVCKTSHKSCEPEQAPQLSNLRVIDCVTRVVEGALTDCSFVALSYVWGQLSADNYVLGSPIAFPPTIEDAVRSTLELGYQYLWVDRYCINQEDPCDKEEQISQMGRIYASAQVTIVAAAGADPSYGLVGISRDRRALSAGESVGGFRFLCLVPETAQDHIARAPWFSRAWTLQEGYLSKRVLCFTEREAIFTCKSCSWTAESTPNAFGFHATFQRDVNEKNVRTALSSQSASLLDASNIMETYSGRVLGYDSDTFNAIMGTLNHMRGCRPQIYHIWGMPFTTTRGLGAAHDTEGSVFISLNWYRYNSGRRLPEFPSWSTLGWRGHAYQSSESEVTPYFMIKYWSGDKYLELDNGTCKLDYSYSRDSTPKSRYLEITTSLVQFELHSQCVHGKIRRYLKSPCVRWKKCKEFEDWPVEHATGPFLWLLLDDETTFDATSPVLCVTTTPPGIVSDYWRSSRDKEPLLLVLQQKERSYERIGACIPPVYGIDMNGNFMCSNKEWWEFVPPGEPGAWDQVSERRTFLLG